MVATTPQALPQPVIGPEQNDTSVSEHLSDLVLVKRTPLWWYAGMGISAALVLWLVIAAGWLF